MSLHAHMHIHNITASQNQGTSLPVDVWFPVISQSGDLTVREEGRELLDNNARSAQSLHRRGRHSHQLIVLCSIVRFEN